jgi:small subunit ribosomal protein S1
VLSIDVERERISLGIKQLEGDPFGNYVTTHDKGNIVKGIVKSIEPKGAGDHARQRRGGLPRASEVARDRVEDLRSHLREGRGIEAVIVNIDRKNRSINLSDQAEGRRRRAGRPAEARLGVERQRRHDEPRRRC